MTAPKKSKKKEKQDTRRKENKGIKNMPSKKVGADSLPGRRAGTDSLPGRKKTTQNKRYDTAILKLYKNDLGLALTEEQLEDAVNYKYVGL
jgi:hypothetical protein